jgi:hypothetical protein
MRGWRRRRKVTVTIPFLLPPAADPARQLALAAELTGTVPAVIVGFAVVAIADNGQLRISTSASNLADCVTMLELARKGEKRP